MGPLVTGAELVRLLDDGDALPADVRWYLDGRSGFAAFEAGHIPGAVFVDVDRVLAGPPGSGPGRHPLPSPAAFARAMTSLGIGDDDLVVAYDDAGGSVAARLWWMLRATGHEAAVLDGGLAAWPRELEEGAGAERGSTTFTATSWPMSDIVDAAAVARRLARGAVVLDARAAERYRGEIEPVDPRAGHIPGAWSAPWSDNVDAEGRFLDPATLRRRYEEHGVTADSDVIAYCGSGITACHDILALHVAGFAPPALYEGSWSDWCSDPDRPIATGDG